MKNVEELLRLPSPAPYPQALAFDGESLWFSSRETRRLYALDPKTWTLRDEVIPMYYERDRDGLPRRWIARMKRAIRTLGGRFSADRMVMDYVRTSYIPAAGGTSSDVSRF